MAISKTKSHCNRRVTKLDITVFSATLETDSNDILLFINIYTPNKKFLKCHLNLFYIKHNFQALRHLKVFAHSYLCRQ